MLSKGPTNLSSTTTPVKQAPPGSSTKKVNKSQGQRSSHTGGPILPIEVMAAKQHSPPPTPLATMSPSSSSATAEWVMSQGAVIALEAAAAGGPKGVVGKGSNPRVSQLVSDSRHASFDLATMASANTEVFYEEGASHSPTVTIDGVDDDEQRSMERDVSIATPVVADASYEGQEAPHAEGSRGLDAKRRKQVAVKSPTVQGPLDTALQAETSNSTGIMDEGCIGVGTVLHNEVETLSCACSEEIDLASSANNRKKFAHMQRRQQEAKRVAHISHDAIQYLSSTPQGKSITRTAEEELVLPLVPNPSMLMHRHQLLEHVCYHVTQALRFSGIQAHVAFYVFGSVHLRTVLPDGDIDVTMVLMEPTKEGYSIHDASQQHQFPAEHAATADHAAASAAGIPLMSPTQSSYSANAEVLPKVRDYLLAIPATGIFVDSLVFAEVRVLKLVANDLSMDFTVDQTGGTSTVCFLHQVDKRLGYHHLFKRTLILLKAWANYEGRVLSGQGGYLGTYALTIMLMGVMNAVLSGAQRRHLTKEEGDDDIANSSRSRQDAKASGRRRLRSNSTATDADSAATAIAELTPLALALRFFAYYSTFDFETHCATIYGALPISALQPSNGSGGIAVTSAASTVTCDLSECEERAAARSDYSAVGQPLQEAVTWYQDSNELLISEAFVADCAAQFGRGSADPAATSTPSASPLVTPDGHVTLNAFPSLASAAVDRKGDSVRGRGDAESSTSSSPSTDKPLSCSKYQQRSPYHPQFSVHLLAAAANVFPVRSMNIMDPLRPSSNLSRGVSRAHVFRIQAAMLHALERGAELLQSVSQALDTLPPPPPSPHSHRRAVDEARLRSGFLEAWFPNTVGVIADYNLRMETEPPHLAQSMQQLTEQCFGGVCKCADCAVPTTMCVTDAYLRRPELVAIPPTPEQHLSQQSASSGHGGGKAFGGPPSASSESSHYSSNHGHNAGSGNGATRFSNSNGSGRGGDQHYRRDPQQGGGWDQPQAHHQHHHPRYHHHSNPASLPANKVWPGRMDDVPQAPPQRPSYPAAGSSDAQDSSAIPPPSNRFATVPTYRAFPSHLQGLPQRLGGGSANASNGGWPQHHRASSNHNSTSSSSAAVPAPTWGGTPSYGQSSTSAGHMDNIPPPPPALQHSHEQQQQVGPPLFASALAFQTHMSAHHHHHHLHHHHHHHHHLGSTPAVLSSPVAPSAAPSAATVARHAAAIPLPSPEAFSTQGSNPVLVTDAKPSKQQASRSAPPSAALSTATAITTGTTVAAASKPREKGVRHPGAAGSSGRGPRSGGRSQDAAASTAKSSQPPLQSPPPLNSDCFPALPS